MTEPVISAADATASACLWVEQPCSCSGASCEQFDFDECGLLGAELLPLAEQDDWFVMTTDAPPPVY